jgi:hypothetical protein
LLAIFLRLYTCGGYAGPLCGTAGLILARIPTFHKGR